MGHAIIAGAGPGGAALAYLLASRGIEVTLVERQRDFAREFRGEVLMPSGIAAIAEMGLEARFAEVAQVRPRAVEAYLDHELVLRLEFARAGVVATVASQPALLEMLVAACGAYPKFRLLRGATVRDLVREDGRVVGLRIDAADGSQELRGDLVVGADGRGSVVRRRARMAPPAASEPFDIVWFKVPYPAFLTRLGEPARAYLSRGHVVLMFRSYDGRLQVAWVIRKGAFGELKRRSAEAWARELASYVPPDLGAHFVEHSTALVHPFLLDVLCYQLPEWTVPGMLLLGDAAHPMSPVGAQGINVALRDAVVAANHLVPVLAGTPSPGAVDRAACRLQAERAPEITEIQTLQRRPPRVIFREVWWSDLALRVVPRLLQTSLGRRLAWQLVARKMLHGTTDVRLTV